MDKETGGPAFPQSGGIEQLESPLNVQGMTLRDYFAAKAIVGILSHPKTMYADGANKLAVCAYQVADAMLEARNA